MPVDGARLPAEHGRCRPIDTVITGQREDEDNSCGMPVVFDHTPEVWRRWGFEAFAAAGVLVRRIGTP